MSAAPLSPALVQDARGAGHRIAFYAPMKSPEHPTPSGDREMARNLMGLLRAGGAEVLLASELRLHEKLGDRDQQQLLQKRAAHVAGELIETLPDLSAFVTYHNYYKAPDLIGPVVAAARNIPYVQIESTRADKRLTGPWADFAMAAHAAADQAQVIFYLTGQDHEALLKAQKPGQVLVHLPPFLPRDHLPAPILPLPEAARPDVPHFDHPPCRLLSVGMMRPGDKLASYALIAETLRRLDDGLHWQLDIIGDGPARPEVEALLRPFGTQVRFFGRQDAAQIATAYDAADVFLWPGVNEAFGMVYLEAQAHGCPVIAQARPGLSDVLSDPQDCVPVLGGAAALAERLSLLIRSPDLRADLAARARDHIAAHHLAPAAATRLWDTLAPLLEQGR